MENVKAIEALVDRTDPGKAIAMITGAMLHDVNAPAARLVREGRRWKLIDDYGDTTIIVRARSIAKAIKAWARRQDITLDGITVYKVF